jgi:hypothetical protein
MTNVDLNPARSAMCNTLGKSDHTTIQRRLREHKGLINNIPKTSSDWTPARGLLQSPGRIGKISREGSNSPAN